MKSLTRMLLGAGVACIAFASAPASAVTYTFVGSWTVDQGPSWTVVPPAYSGQTAAAMLFGGSASDYAISTIDSSAANIDFLSWVSTWGGACNGTYPCGTRIAQDAVTSTGGLYASVGDTSAYVSDWAAGSEYTNYAFAIAAVPEPASWAMMIAGIGMVGGVARRRRSVTVRYA